MKRKIIQLSPTTLAVTLPKKWADKNFIKKGDELKIEEEPHKIIFSTTQRKGLGEKANIDLIKLGVFEKNFISTLYQAGVDEININYNDQNILPIIEDHINKYCVGFDIVEQTSSFIKIKSITTEIIIDFEQMYKKNMQLMVQLMTEINHAVQNSDFTNIKNTRLLEERENKIQNLCLRYVSKHGFTMNPRRERAAYELIREIENICDCMKRICDVFIKNKITTDKDLKEYFNTVTNFVKSFYESYYSMKKESLKIFFVEGKKYLEQGYDLLEKSKGKKNLLYTHLIEIINRTYFLSHPFFELIN